MRYVFTLAVLVLALGLAAGQVYADRPARRLSSPPMNAAVFQWHGTTFTMGQIYLSAHSDTSLLRPFGFRRFEFLGWSLARAHYSAIWPLRVHLDSLPVELSDLEYALDEQPADEFPPDEEEYLAGSPPPSTASLTENGELDTGWTSDLWGRDSLEAAHQILEPDWAQGGNSNLLIYGTPAERRERRDAILRSWGWKRTKDGRWQPGRNSGHLVTHRQHPNLRDDPHTRGNFIGSPVEDGPFHRPENVGYSYPGGTTFRIQPVESGPFHTPGSVTSRDPDRTGTYFITADRNQSTLQTTTIQEMSRHWPENPYHLFGPVERDLRNDWGSIGYRGNLPNTQSGWYGVTPDPPRP
jgi:hypothetical protein